MPEHWKSFTEGSAPNSHAFGLKLWLWPTVAFILGHFTISIEALHKLGISLPVERQPFAVILCGCNSNISKVCRPRSKKYLFPLILQGWFLVCKKNVAARPNIEQHSRISGTAVSPVTTRRPPQQWKAGMEIGGAHCWHAAALDPNLQPQTAWMDRADGLTAAAWQTEYVRLPYSCVPGSVFWQTDRYTDRQCVWVH